VAASAVDCQPRRATMLGRRLRNLEPLMGPNPTYVAPIDWDRAPCCAPPSHATRPTGHLSCGFDWVMPGDRTEDAHRSDALARFSHRTEAHRGLESGKLVLRSTGYADSRGSPMRTECGANEMEFGRAGGHRVLADFDGGTMSSHAGRVAGGRDGQGQIRRRHGHPPCACSDSIPSR
jgi:hypothetical protein